MSEFETWLSFFEEVLLDGKNWTEFRVVKYISEQEHWYVFVARGRDDERLEGEDV